MIKEQFNLCCFITRAFSALGVIFLTPAAALAIELTSNLSNVTSGAESATPNRFLTASFGTGASTHTLNSVTLRLANTSPGTAQVLIYSSGGLEPGSLVATLTSPASYPTNFANTAFTTAGVNLTANTTYWVVLKPISGQFDWAWTNDNSGTGVGFTHTWGFADDPPTAGTAGAWWTYDSYQTQLSVTVDVTACVGDITGNQVVNVDDLLAVINAWGPCPAPCPPACAADITQNCVVNVDDLLAVINAWGPCP